MTYDQKLKAWEKTIRDATVYFLTYGVYPPGYVEPPPPAPPPPAPPFMHDPVAGVARIIERIPRAIEKVLGI